MVLIVGEPLGTVDRFLARWNWLDAMTDQTTAADATVHLKRVLTLPLVVLYGLGVTIGAGIYVLVGETAGRAGMAAPSAFLLAALVMLFPALSFAELACRYPFAAGAAQYSEESFRSRAVGLRSAC